MAEPAEPESPDEVSCMCVLIFEQYTQSAFNHATTRHLVSYKGVNVLLYSSQSHFIVTSMFV